MPNLEKSASSKTKLKARPLRIRTKVLAAYGVLVCLFFFILVIGFSQFRAIASKINLLQQAYLPLSTRIAGFSSLYHLDENFGYDNLEKNYRNPLFVNAAVNLNPRIFERGLQRGISDTEKILAQSTHFDAAARQSLGRLTEITEQLLVHHREYVSVMDRTIRHLQENKTEGARTLAEDLAEKKRSVKSHLELLSNRVNDLTKRTILEIVQSERRGVFAIAALSLFTFLLAIVIGLISIRALRPLEKLKRTAREIASGNFSIRADIESSDEVGELATEFNTMADALQVRDKALHDQQERLVESQKMAVIGQMASKISHEIRNPLNALSLNVELLEEKIESTSTRELVTAISREIERLHRVTVRYLDMARTPKGQSQPAQISSILSHIHGLLSPECDQLGVSMEMDFAADLPELRLDSTGLEQALVNLARNAMEASKRGSAFGIRTRKSSESVEIEIWDQGPGIPSDDVSKIFEPFYTTKTKGTGLGLAITREIVHDLGGSLTFVSDQGRGTMFTIQLPLHA